MSLNKTVTCDFDGKDIGTGDGQHWRLAVYEESVPIRPGTEPHLHARNQGRVRHFCDEMCCASYMIAASEKKAEERAAKLKADAGAAAAKAEAKEESVREESARVSE